MNNEYLNEFLYEQFYEYSYEYPDELDEFSHQNSYKLQISIYLFSFSPEILEDISFVTSQSVMASVSLPCFESYDQFVIWTEPNSVSSLYY